jgi:quercetin dioxygenase-like cupin family protein
MADIDPQITPAVADYIARMMARPIIPTESEQDTLHVGADDLPWLEAGDGSAIQLLHVDLNQGLWISKSRVPAGHKVMKHYHTGLVFAVTLQGRWFYAETPDAVNSSGSYLFEPAGSIHTLCTPEDQAGDTIAWFAIYGANINLDADGKIASVYDARAVLDIYRGYCEALELDCSKLIVAGE